MGKHPSAAVAVLAELRELGLKVAVQHERLAMFDRWPRLDDGRTLLVAESSTLAPVYMLRKRGLGIATEGGRTVVRISEFDGPEIGIGEAICSPRDTFCRAVGLTKATGRALADIQQRHGSLLRDMRERSHAAA
ncbi:MAG TPA: hypothetical protein VG265_16550 [Gaiellaceae bacterium]|jgi:hypothetical protein|nr:hypothetical protein [Gaiellaceae bacterium]